MDGQYATKREPWDQAALRRELTALRDREGLDAQLVIRADREIPHRKAVRVMEVAKELRFTKLAIAVNPAPSDP